MRTIITKHIFLLCFLLVSFHLAAQPNIISLRRTIEWSLKQPMADTAKVRLMIQLSGNYKTENHTRTNLDSALQIARRALISAQRKKSLSQVGDCYDLISKIYEDLKDLPQAVLQEKLAIQSYKSDQNQVGTGDGYRQLGRYYNYNDPAGMLQRIRNDSIALVYYIKAKNQIKQGETLQSLGNYYYLSNETAKAIKALQMALSAYNAVNFKSTQGVYFFLNQCYNQIGDLRQALNFGLKAIAVAEAVKDSSAQFSAICNHLGATYLNLGQSDQSVFYFKLGIRRARINHDLETANVMSINLASIYLTLNRAKDAIAILNQISNATDMQAQAVINGIYIHAYVLLDQLDRAQKYYERLVAVLPVTDPKSFLRENMDSKMIFYLFHRKKYKEAETLLAEFDELVHYHHEKKFIIMAQHWAFRLDSAQANFLSAIKHTQVERMLQDSFLNEAKTISISRLEVQYKTEKKEHELRLKNQHIELLTKQGLLQKAGLQKAMIMRNVIIAGSIMLVVLLLVSYNRYQIKQRSHILLQQQQDVINKKNHSLQRLVGDKDLLLMEKEWLLKEIHHRVKNNLQIVISLLNSQSSYLDNDAALSAIRESQHRMHSISLIHQKLYQSDNLAQIDMVDYIVELTEYLQESFGTGNRITMDLQVEPISLDVAQAVPVGLILNEAVTNAIKYAFEPDTPGTITISLDGPKPNFVILTISDNGVGLPAGFDVGTSKSLGMSLMNGLSSQLQGDFSLVSKNGLTLKLEIPTKVIPIEENYFTV